MDTAIWVVQILLAVAFLMAGAMKLTQSKEKLAENMAWVNDFSANQVRTIGLLELLGAVGLVLPMALDILPILIPLAAVGLVLNMIGAAFTHHRRDEYNMIPINLVLLALALFVAIGRLAIEPVI